MGKYLNSDIHERYSDFHYELIQIDVKYKKLYVSDIDRLWIEYDFARKAIVSVIDIKYCKNGKTDYGTDTMTATERGIYQWFAKNGVSVYIVFITRDFKLDVTEKRNHKGKFFVINALGKFKTMGCEEYADWLLSLRSYRKQDEYNWKDLDKEIMKEINGTEDIEIFKQLSLFAQSKTT